MEDHQDRVRLRRGARGLGWELEPEAVDRLLLFRELLLRENAQVNLTGVRDPAEFLERHLLDSLALGLHLKTREAAPGSLLDLGTGGGIPGLVLAIVCPHWEVHLVEGRSRKLAAVERLVGELGCERVHCHAARLEELLRRDEGLVGSLDLVTARAVGPLAKIAATAAPALRPGAGVLVCWKSDALPDTERREGLRSAHREGLEALPDLPYTSFKPCLLVRYRRRDAP